MSIQFQEEKGKIEFLEPPMLKEILEQQRLLIDVHSKLVEAILKPPILYKTEK